MQSCRAAYGGTMRQTNAAADIATAFVAAWNRKDADALAGLFVEDADFVNVVGLWWANRDQIRKAHAYGFEHIFGDSTMELRKVRVREVGAGVAVVHAAWTLTGQNPHQDRTAGRRRGVITFTAQRQAGGGWLAVSAQNTDRVNGAETLIATGDTLDPARYGG